MRKLHSVLAVLIFISLFVFSSFLKLEINNPVAEGLNTFFSVILGFYISSISILCTSSYIGRLYNEEDPNIKGQGRLRTLRNYFFYSCIISILSIILIVFYNLYFASDVIYALIDFEIKDLWSAVIISLSGVNVFLMFLLLKMLLTVLLKEGKLRYYSSEQRA